MLSMTHILVFLVGAGVQIHIAVFDKTGKPAWLAKGQLIFSDFPLKEVTNQDRLFRF